MVKHWFEWLCSIGNHGPIRVKWGYRFGCNTCTHMAWKRGWY